MNKVSMILLCLLSSLVFLCSVSFAEYIVIDHNCNSLSQISDEWIDTAQAKIKWHYGHTSHGEQLTIGLERIESTNSKYEVALSNYSSDSSLSQLPDEPGALCICNLYRTTNYFSEFEEDISNNPGINTSMFSWCSELNEYSSEQVQWYLDSMNQLEIAYPNVIFIYITGNAQRDGAGGYNRYLRNQQIRNYCLANDKIIFDFGDLDSWWYNQLQKTGNKIRMNIGMNGDRYLMLDIRENSRKREVSAMPRTQRLIIDDEIAVYHVMSRTALEGFPLGDIEKD